MVSVPAGAFWMGCRSPADAACDDDERPYHQVDLAAFSIDRTEVTNGQYIACAMAGVCPQRGSFPSADLPVTNISRDLAATYCRWVGKRLPTEAEWEKAARGADGRIYPWGNDPPTCDRANFTECGGTLKPAGSLPAGASPYGALDMAGNAIEWVSDWYDAQAYSAATASMNPTGPPTGVDGINRSGSYLSFAKVIRASERVAVTPNSVQSHVGFRCAL